MNYLYSYQHLAKDSHNGHKYISIYNNRINKPTKMTWTKDTFQPTWKLWKPIPIKYNYCIYTDFSTTTEFTLTTPLTSAVHSKGEHSFSVFFSSTFWVAILISSAVGPLTLSVVKGSLEGGCRHLTRRSSSGDKCNVPQS